MHPFISTCCLCQRTSRSDRMSSFTINMDGSKDAGYRYTMPQLELTQLGKKTKCLSNLATVSQRVGRTSEMLLAFFNHEVGSLRGTSGCELKKNGVCTVPCFMEQKELQQAVLDFIRRHVMCQECKNPETRISALEHGTTVLKCDACGRTAPSAHKASPAFFTWMQDHPEHLEAVGRLKIATMLPSCADEGTWSFPPSADDAVASDDWVS
jgi:translation initiation factor 2 beta subunit (eIF-2beta)/eIF-5